MASKGVNKVILVGNIGRDPESRVFQDGNMITNCALATSETWKDKQTGQPQERTEWHRVVFKDRGAYKLGEIASQHITKGDKLYIEGKLVTRSWEAPNAAGKRYATEVIVEEFQFLGSRPAGDEQQEAPRQAPRQPPAAGTAGQRGGPDPTKAPSADFGNFDDDIPF
jgi:single-strand DNA-binding protein